MSIATSTDKPRRLVDMEFRPGDLPTADAAPTIEPLPDVAPPTRAIRWPAKLALGSAAVARVEGLHLRALEDARGAGQHRLDPQHLELVAAILVAEAAHQVGAVVVLREGGPGEEDEERGGTSEHRRSGCLFVDGRRPL